MEIVADGDTRWLQLPSGRAIGYHRLKTEWVTTQYGTRKRQHSFADPKKPGRVRTYGGRLTENATQAVARDLLAEALLQLAEAGLPVVAHVHDEVIIERATATTLRDAVAVMTTPPTWADGLPIGAEGFTTYRYRKG